MDLFDFLKVLGALAMPTGLLWLLLLGLAALLLRRRQWLAGILVLVAWTLYGTIGNFYLGSALMAGLERAVPPVAFEDLRPFDAVFVLGGGTELDPAGQPILDNAGDRVVTAARLWHLGKARILVASGGGRDAPGGPRDLAQETRAIWLGLGVPEAAIVVIEEPCLNTRQEIAAYRRLQDRRRWDRLALVSSASHLPRALGLAARAGLTVTPVGADYHGRRHTFQLQRMVPQGEGFLLTSRACWEYLGRML